MKYLFGILVIVLLAVNSFFGAYQVYHKPEHKEEIREFNLQDKQFLQDLPGKAVLVPSTGQMWVFGEEQSLTFKGIEKKVMGENLVMVAGMVSADSLVRDKGKSSKVNLTGMVKLNYENFGKEWFLVSVEPVSVSVKVK